MDDVIRVEHLVKEFNVPKKPRTLFQRVKNVFIRDWEVFRAVDDISFTVGRGEFLGLLGKNGSGKTTTIKILSGILTPTSGRVNCLGEIPWKRRKEYLKRIGVLFGNRSNLIFDIELEESFLMYKDIYELSDSFYDQRMRLLTQLLDLEDLLHIPVRKLSFGQRMRGELGVVFLHRPELVFLDEPTIGIDPLAKEKVHRFLHEINKRDGVTVVLTTHNIDDVERLCERVIVLSKGKVVFDGAVDTLRERYVKYKDVIVEFTKVKDKRQFNKMVKMLEDVEMGETYFRGRLSKRRQKTFFEMLTSSVELSQMDVTEPALEEIIKEIYRER